jgi:hypothetical protein
MSAKAIAAKKKTMIITRGQPSMNRSAKSG